MLYDASLPMGRDVCLCARVCVETDRMSPGLTLKRSLGSANPDGSEK